MGEAPHNPTGFVHGFRPLEGDHPPPTPTQRDQPSQYSHSQGLGLSAMTQQIPVEAHRGAVGMGSGAARKRRRLPGPLAFLQQGASGGLVQQDGGGDSDKDTGKQRSGDESSPDEGEAGAGHFWKGPWLSLCSATDAPIAEACASDSEAMQAFLRGAVSPISEVLAGDFDLRVPIVTAVIDTYTKLSISDVIVDLVDPSGRIRGYLHPGCLEEHGPFLGPGAALLLKEVSIFVTGPGTTRLLNVHPDCVLAVFPADSPLPDPQRLEWLATCDPPFTPRPMPDLGDESRTQREPSSRTPSPTRPPPKSPTSRVARSGATSGRVRARPHTSEGGSQRGSHKQTHQQQQQRHATPKSSSPRQRSVEPLQGQWKGQQQKQHGQHDDHDRDDREGGRRREGLEWEEQEQEPSPPQKGSTSRRSETQDGETRTTSLSIGTPHGKWRVLPSPSSSPPLFSQSQLQSQSQSQTLQEIALGQHSDSEAEHPGVKSDGFNDDRDHDGEEGSKSVIDEGSGENDTVGEDAALRDRSPTTNARHTLRQENKAELTTVRGVESPPGDNANLSIRYGSDATQRAPAVEGERARAADSVAEGAHGKEELTAKVEGTDENDRHKAAGSTPSIWADLDGLGSSSDDSNSSNSGDEDIVDRSPSLPLPEGLTASGGSGDTPGQSLSQEMRQDQQQRQQQQQSVEEGSGRSGDRNPRDRESSVLQSTPNSITSADTGMDNESGTKYSVDSQDVFATAGVEAAAPAAEVVNGFALAGSAGFSLLGDAVGHDELLDAALDDSD